MNRLSINIAAMACFACCVTCPARADLFKLTHGGEVQGELLNPNQSPRTSYQIRTSSGAVVTLAGDLVGEVVARSPQEIQYEKLLPRMPNSARGNWLMAEWCENAGLKTQREFHLGQVLKHDPHHEKARYALGYNRVDGHWIRPEDHMKSRGFVRYKGQWRLPQDVAIEQFAARQEELEKGWVRKIRMWRTWAMKGRGDGTAAGLRNIRDIEDPMAAPVLIQLLQDEDEPTQLKQLYVEVLGKIGNPAAVPTLIDRALNDPSDRTRELALQQLRDLGRQSAVAVFAKTLENKDNRLVNRAASGLAAMGEPSVTPQLIDALVTKHQFLVKQGGNMNVGFSPQGGVGGLNLGGGPKVIDQEFRNDQVLGALTSLNPGVNYSFDEDAWRAWYVDEQTPSNINLRRDP